MALKNPKLNREFKTLFECFKDKYSELENIVKDKGENDRDEIIPKSLRLSRVRLLLVTGMKINFDDTYSLTTEEKIEKTYIQIIKCCEAWFAFEGIQKLADVIDKKEPKNPIVFSQDTFDNKFNSAVILRIYNDELKSWIVERESRDGKEQIKKYVIKLKNVMYSNFLKELLQDFADNISSETDANDYHILAMIYATRNVFVHKGESAYFGEIIYKNKHDFLELSYDYIIVLMFKAIIYYCDKQLRKLKDN